MSERGISGCRETSHKTCRGSGSLAWSGDSGDGERGVGMDRQVVDAHCVVGKQGGQVLACASGSIVGNTRVLRRFGEGRP